MIVWITGYSSSGKTSTGRSLKTILEKVGHTVVILDGDDIRNILNSRFGYSREERIELGMIYLKLATYVASQGIYVIVCAIAIYEEIIKWLQVNNSNHMIFFVDTPKELRLARDQVFKHVYKSKQSLEELYDNPSIIENKIIDQGDRTPEDIAEEIFTRMLNKAPRKNYKNDTYWNDFYTQALVSDRPSAFAEHVVESLKEGSRILEIGCGNGRDARFFASRSFSVTGIDRSPMGIEYCNKLNSPGATFHTGAIDQVFPKPSCQFDVAYLRFVLHAMTEQEELKCFQFLRKLLHVNGRIYLEARSVNDPLYRRGEVLSPTERIHGHYRRFIVRDRLVNTLRELNFAMESVVEGKGLATYGDEDPVVIRVTCRKLRGNPVSG